MVDIGFSVILKYGSPIEPPLPKFAIIGCFTSSMVELK